MSEAIGTVAIDEGTGLPAPYCGTGISDLAPIPPETGPVKLMTVEDDQDKPLIVNG